MSIKNFLMTLMWCVLLWAPNLSVAEQAAQQAVPIQQKNVTAPPAANATTPKQPKVNILASGVCKKCICDAHYKKLDCSNTEMVSWFSTEEWKTLQNGDVIFETIKLEHNNFTTIPQLPEYPVKNLYLSYNKIASISLGAFQNFSQLTKLDLSHNKLTSKAMVPDIFKGNFSARDYLPMKEMRELDLGYNELHNLDPDLFEHLPNLEALVLGGNIFHVIDHLTETAIAGLTSIKTLDMSYMELKDLPDNFLHGPRELETLILTGNLLDELPDNLELAINLQRLVLDENEVESFSGENVFPAMQSLKYLSIAYMPQLKKIDKGAFSNLQNLTTLIASDNKNLSYIDPNAFSRKTINPRIFDYPPLEKLYLNNGNLSTIPFELVERWDKIKIIDLQFNPWNCDCHSNDWLIKSLMVQINESAPQLTRNVICGYPYAYAATPVMKLTSDDITIICDDENTGSTTRNLVFIGLFVGVLLGIPLTLATLVLYRRGCFGLVNRKNSANRYSRATFAEDF